MEKILAQRSKITWLQCGDDNNVFFHASARETKNRVEIYQLEKEDDDIMSSTLDIEQEVLRFFKFGGEAT